MTRDEAMREGVANEKVLRRFWAKVVRGEPWECWVWAASCQPDGYGRFAIGRSGVSAHRFSYVIHAGPIPDGLTIDHLCRNRSCVNPAHLEPVTRGLNVLRGESLHAQNARKTHCKRGHEFTPENTRLVVDKKGASHRMCRRCSNDANNVRRRALAALSQLPTQQTTEGEDGCC